MSTAMVGVGEMSVAADPGDQLSAPGLGSCVALVLIDVATWTVGMAHIALPDSRTDQDRRKRFPGHFADTSVPALISEMVRSGAGTNTRNYVVKLVGGARLLDPRGIFNIGQRNVEALREALQQQRIQTIAEDVGGAISRTVRASVHNGHVTVSVSSPGCGVWEL